MIGPKSSESVCILKLNAGYEVKTNFRYIIRDVSKEIQEALLVEHNKMMDKKIKEATAAWQDTPTDIMPIDALLKECKQRRTNFIDSEFPPSQKSVFGEHEGKVTFDTCI